MQSLRMLSRALPKSSLRPLSSRSYSAICRSTLRPSWQATKLPSYPAFSTSIAKREAAGTQDAELIEKLQHEQSLEISSNDPNKIPQEIEAFKADGIWEVIDRPGTHEITLQRSFGNETIKVEMSITDVTEMGEEDEFDQDLEDGALADEAFQQPRRTINQSGTKGGPIDVVPEDSVAPADREGEFGEDGMHSSYPIHLTITITKPGNEMVEISASSQDGAIQTHQVQYLPANDPTDDTTTPYAGPPFTNLDSDLQANFEEYLEERGIHAELATILPIFLEWKEQREYVDWLGNMKKFIEA